MKPLKPSQISRIARGAGRSNRDVNNLLEEYKRMAKVCGVGCM